MKNHRERRAFTLIELLVVIAIIAILASILFPVFARAREAARQTSCRSNLKQIATAVQMYRQDYDEVTVPLGEIGANANSFTLPNGTTNQNILWNHLLNPYLKNYGIFNCPSNFYSPPSVYAGDFKTS